MALLTYSPKDVYVSIAGLHVVQGYADGTFIKITKDMQPFEKQRAMDGEIARIYREDEGYRFELTLAQSSGTNNVLSAIYNIDTVTRMGKFPLFIKDTLGQSLFLSATTWIEQIPEVTFSNQMETRTWRFGCAQAALTIGGNAKTNMIEDAILQGSSFLPLLKEFGVF